MSAAEVVQSFPPIAGGIQRNVESARTAINILSLFGFFALRRLGFVGIFRLCQQLEFHFTRP